MRTETINPIQDISWKRFVEDNPESNIFQHPLYLEALIRTFRHLSPLAFIIRDSGGHIRAGWPFLFAKSRLTGRRLVSLPFASYSDPLVAADGELEALISQVFKFRDAHQVDYIKLKTLHKSEVVEASGCFTPSFDQKTHILDLRPGLEMVRKKLHRTRIRRFLSRSEKHGIEVRRASSLRELRLFYDLLLISRKRIGLPPQYFDFFSNIWSLLSPAGFVSMLRADLPGSPAGFLFYLKYGKTISPEYIGISAEYYPLGINQVLCWAAIQEGTREGYEYFDFGKSYVNQLGLLSYKTGWGAIEMDAPSFFYPPSKVRLGHKNQRLTYRILSEMFKRLPLSVSKPAGRLLYKHLD